MGVVGHWFQVKSILYLNFAKHVTHYLIHTTYTTCHTYYLHEECSMDAEDPFANPSANEEQIAKLKSLRERNLQAQKRFHAKQKV